VFRACEVHYIGSTLILLYDGSRLVALSSFFLPALATPHKLSAICTGNHLFHTNEIGCSLTRDLMLINAIYMDSGGHPLIGTVDTKEYRTGRQRRSVQQLEDSNREGLYQGFLHLGHSAV
jgi:hypothetical protein